MPKPVSKYHIIFSIIPSSCIRNIARNLSENSAGQTCHRHCDNLKNLREFPAAIQWYLEDHQETDCPRNYFKTKRV